MLVVLELGQDCVLFEEFKSGLAFLFRRLVRFLSVRIHATFGVVRKGKLVLGGGGSMAALLYIPSVVFGQWIVRMLVPAFGPA